MAIDAETFKLLGQFSAKALEAILRKDVQTKAAWKNAVGHLQRAVLETLTYVESDTSDKDTERRLVKLWGNASEAFYGLDGDLAARFQLKAEYWTNKHAWDSDQVREAGISLNQVAALTRQLLHESSVIE